MVKTCDYFIIIRSGVYICSSAQGTVVTLRFICLNISYVSNYIMCLMARNRKTCMVSNFNLII